jgi:isopentenyl phosphate kinase
MAVEGAVIKLGGSVVTDKASDELRVDVQTVRRLAAELAAAAVRPLVLVHGAGSYGHRIVQRSGIHRGLSDAASRLAMGETQRLQYELDSRIASLMMAAGLPVMPVQASASARMESGRLIAMDTDALALMCEQGLVPLLYGVPAVDCEQGCSILSGDQIAPYVARQLRIRTLVHVTDVDGVYDDDPARNLRAAPITRIDRDNWGDIRRRLSGSSAVDVTGGMAGKVGALLDLAREGLVTRIVSGRIPGRMGDALAGESVGTLVCWEVE